MKRYSIMTMKAYFTICTLITLLLILSGIIMLRVQHDKEDQLPVESYDVPPQPVVTEPQPKVMQDEIDEEPIYVIEDSLVFNELTPSYTEEELNILALIVYQEAGEDAVSDDTRRLVAQVFLNRVADERFPDTFYEVATAERQYGKLHWTGIEWPDRASYDSEKHAVNRAYEIAKEVLESDEPVCPATVVFQAEFIQGDIYAHQDGMYFCHG